MQVPSLKSLRTFQVAARLRSIKAAAAELCVTCSAVGYQLRALQAQVGAPLFEQGERGLTLTEEGARYLEDIDGILAKLEAVTMRFRARACRSTIRVDAPPFFANELLLPRLASFARGLEGTQIRVRTKLALPKAHAVEADLSIVVGSGPWHGLIAHPLFEQSFIPACSPRFLREHRIDSYADLNGKTLLLHMNRPDVWERWAMGQRIAPIRPDRLVCLESMPEVVLAAEQGAGVALVPARLSADRFAARGLVKLFPAELTIDESYVLVRREEDRAREDLQALTHWILRECRAA